MKVRYRAARVAENRIENYEFNSVTKILSCRLKTKSGFSKKFLGTSVPKQGGVNGVND